VVEFGRTAGERGPDAISVGGDGEVHFWDSKWRDSDTSIGPSGRAHRTDTAIMRRHANPAIGKIPRLIHSFELQVQQE